MCSCWLHAEEIAKDAKEPAAASNPDEGAKPETATLTGDTEMKAADTDMPTKEADPKTDSPTKTSYQMSVKTDEKSAAVSDSQAGDASTHEATTEVKAAAQVEEAASDGSSPGDVGKLDVHLTYLWEVHRVNFYVGGDFQHAVLSMPPYTSVFSASVLAMLGRVVYQVPYHGSAVSP